ncbi:hypothetical protein [Vitiosangium sp. GDMCC 1.1324]|uniref:hypothetical protein n=1 Tax=Vitiosangium sp. (strain GDMCC 1.1324) TaxID=2138576 RepID=UPI000D3A3BB7|nr:hypothetical protein [Vitiosangium sp. GDMCC 1.1324]PTL75659.1 hypothetical protein DAT35_53535 [Vitiosangium sp. GDMCC 1.1324]
MRAWLVVMMMTLAGCSVQVTGAPCQDDLQCPSAQRCTSEGRCVAGARSGEHLLESCSMAMETLARRADQCYGGMTSESYQRLADMDSVCASVVASVQAGRQAFIPERFGACVRQLRDLPCGAMTLDDFSEGNLLARCEALVPQAAEGNPCGNNLDCQGGWCDTSAGCTGVCKRYVPAGSGCDGSVPCQPGSTCSLNVCRADANLGESCAWGVRCAPEANAACVDNRCVARKASGACKSADECEPGHACVKLNVEAGSDSPRECRPARGLDEPCTPGASECGGLLYCEAATSRCRPWRELGQTCYDPDGTKELALCLGSRCAFGAYLQLVCQSYVAPGGTCLTDADCGPTGACHSNACITTWCR